MGLSLFFAILKAIPITTEIAHHKHNGGPSFLRSTSLRIEPFASCAQTPTDMETELPIQRLGGFTVYFTHDTAEFITASVFALIRPLAAGDRSLNIESFRLEIWQLPDGQNLPRYLRYE